MAKLHPPRSVLCDRRSLTFLGRPLPFDVGCVRFLCRSKWQATFMALLQAFAADKSASRAAWVLDEMLEMQVSSSSQEPTLGTITLAAPTLSQHRPSRSTWDRTTLDTSGKETAPSPCTIGSDFPLRPWMSVQPLLYRRSATFHPR